MFNNKTPKVYQAYWYLNQHILTCSVWREKSNDGIFMTWQFRIANNFPSSLSFKWIRRQIQIRNYQTIRNMQNSSRRELVTPLAFWQHKMWWAERITTPFYRFWESGGLVELKQKNNQTMQDSKTNNSSLWILKHKLISINK